MITPKASARRGEAIHRRFRPRPGSNYVASGFALGAVDHLIRSRRPQAILEVGAGIGALTAAIAEACDGAGLAATHVAIEDVPFCLEQLAANLGPRLEGIEVHPYVRDVPVGGPTFDLVIIDGGATEDLLPEDQHLWTAADEEAEVGSWIGRLSPGALVLVENRRDRQRGFIEALAIRPMVHEHVRPLDAGPGYHLYWVDPSATRRLAVAVAEGWRRVWFPRGVRAQRLLYHKLHGRPKPKRDTVAPGLEGD